MSSKEEWIKNVSALRALLAALHGEIARMERLNRIIADMISDAERLTAALDRMASIEARTRRGEAIKARGAGMEFLRQARKGFSAILPMRASRLAAKKCAMASAASD